MGVVVSTGSVDSQLVEWRKHRPMRVAVDAAAMLY